MRPHVAIPAGRPSMQCETRRVSTLLQNGKCQRASTHVSARLRPRRPTPDPGVVRCSEGRRAGPGYPMAPRRRILTQSHTRHDAPSLLPRNVCAPRGRSPPGAGPNLRRSGAATGTGSAAKDFRAIGPRTTADPWQRSLASALARAGRPVQRQQDLHRSYKLSHNLQTRNSHRHPREALVAGTPSQDDGVKWPHHVQGAG